MANATIQPSRDWLGSRGSSVLAWWIPHAAILAGLFVPTPIRVVVWTIALIWMGAACILNARQCGRTHCRYTGPYYLAMIAPVLVLGSGMVSPQGFTDGLCWASSLLAGASSFGGQQSGHGEDTDTLLTC
jgi:hypothetical protein